LKSIENRNGSPYEPATRWNRGYIELWTSLARAEWGSLVVIPADRDGSSADVADVLAGIGQQLSYGPVTAVTVSKLEYGSALALADLQQHLKRERRLNGRLQRVMNVSSEADGPDPSPEDGARSSVSPGAPEPRPVTTKEPAQGPGPEKPAPGAARTSSEEEPTSPKEALAVMPSARLIISLPPVVTEPLALVATEHADLVVVVIRLNRSRVTEVKRTVSLLGRERIAGCILVG